MYLGKHQYFNNTCYLRICLYSSNTIIIIIVLLLYRQISNQFVATFNTISFSSYCNNFMKQSFEMI